jgi:hypothetical protein
VEVTSYRKDGGGAARVLLPTHDPSRPDFQSGTAIVAVEDQFCLAGQFRQWALSRVCVRGADPVELRT